MVGDEAAHQLAAICSLGDPTRRRLYDYVVAQPGPVSRDEASAALDLDRSVVVYHLDRLVDEGLLVASFSRPPGRGGPGAGRPAKRYERADAEFSVTVPQREYELAAEVLARAADHDPTDTVRAALDDAAASLGRELAATSTTPTLAGVLAEHGFAPFDDAGVLRLRNCPFHHLARRHTELICGMNRTLLDAVARERDATVAAVLDPAPGRCCVAFVPPDPPG